VRLLSRRSSAIAPRPPANKGNDAGSGIADAADALSEPVGNSLQKDPVIHRAPVNVVDPPGAITASEVAGINVRLANVSDEEWALIEVEVDPKSVLKRSDWEAELGQPVAVIAKFENTPPL
jgi:hypothetical protein